MSNFRRSWSKVGTRAISNQKQGFSNSYLFTAIAPLTGESFHLMCLDEMSTNTELTFLKELKKEHPDKNVVVVIDNAPCHKPKCLHIIPGLLIIYLPSYSPELNPVERFFEEIRRATCNTVFSTMEALEEVIKNAVNSWTPEMLKQLCCYDWIKEQCVGVS